TALFGPWLLAWGFWSWRLARARRRGDPATRRARSARATFEAAAGSFAADPAEAYAEYLAARLGSHRAAVVAPDLRARLVRAGVGTELATAAAALLEELAAARYGGSAAADGHRRATAMVSALEAHFAAGDVLGSGAAR